jgi:hypothetical protein
MLRVGMFEGRWRGRDLGFVGRVWIVDFVREWRRSLVIARRK